MSTNRRRTRRKPRHRFVVAGVALACATFASASSLRAEPNGEHEVTVEVAPTEYDGLQTLLDEEARQAMNEGNYKRALRLFRRLLKIDPYDVRALREAGRVAKALGKLEYAVEVFRRVDDLDGTTPDPELHYLRGESLHALGRKQEANAEFAIAEAELGAGPHDRQGTLWLARIAVLRGDLERADRLYDPLLRDPNATAASYTEVMLSKVEAHILCGDWVGAEALLESFLTEYPDHDRGRALLAWVLEGRGKVDEELALRAEAARERNERPRKTLEYARALERSRDYSAALDHYKEARSLGVTEASAGIIRIEQRLAPEIGGGVAMRTDPSGTISAWRAGATMPFGARLRLAVTANGESSSEGVLVNEAERTSRFAAGWLILNSRRGGMLAVGPNVRLGEERDGGVGGSAALNTSPQRDVQVQLRSDYNVVWNESASTLRYGGVQDTVGAHLYLKSEVSQREVLASFSVQGRRLGLEPVVAMEMIRASQLFASGGLDVQLTGAGGRAIRSEIFDGEMLHARSMNPATIVSYRHYELFGEDPFGERLVLVERSSIDELSAVVRRVEPRGVLGGELRGGLGYDWVRYVKQWRAGASLLLAATTTSRLTVDYDMASESGTGLVGRRHTGSVVLHVDL
jgi:Flp pilus assembly protein TadD